MLAHVARTYEGEKTSAEIQEEADKLFWKYNTSSREYDGLQVIEKNEAWHTVSEDDHQREAEKRELSNLYYNLQAGFGGIDQDHDDILMVEDLIGYVPEEDIVGLYGVIGLNTVTDVLQFKELFEKYTLVEHYGFKRLRNVWMEAYHDDVADYSFTLADISNEESMDHLEIESLDELDDLFKSMDKNGDGQVDGEEACRYYVQDSDFMCGKFSPD